MVQITPALFVLASFISAAFATPVVGNDDGLQKREAEVTHSGRATWFDVGLGACGHTDSNSSPVVAISSQIYGSGGNCDQWMQITDVANGKTAYGQVRDECPGCGQYDIDLSPSLFQQFGNLDQGVLSVQWHYMAKGWSP